MVYTFKLEKFEGPLDLLLNLIEENKLQISEISLSKVGEDFLNYLKNFQELPREEAAYFLVIAATLMLIKSKSLLPFLEIDKEEEKSIEELEFRLKQLRFFKELSLEIQKTIQKNNFIFFKEINPEKKLGFYPGEKLNIGRLKEVVDFLLNSLPKKEKLPEKILTRVISIEKKIEELIGRIQKLVKSSFDELIDPKDKIDRILSFLAVLELIKQGLVAVEQEKTFGKIELSKI